MHASPSCCESLLCLAQVGPHLGPAEGAQYSSVHHTGLLNC